LLAQGDPKAASLEAIASNIKSPPQLETLLNQINRDFAVPLLAFS
jgi:hypothetical protein